MVVNTLPRDYDIARIIDDYERRIVFLERQALLSPVSLSIWRDVPGGFDTGWQNLTLNANFPSSGLTPQIRRYGPHVSCRGRVTNPGALTGSQTLAQAPAGFDFFPAQIDEGFILPAQATRLFVTTAGAISTQGLTAATGDKYLSGLDWMVNAPA